MSSADACDMVIALLRELRDRDEHAAIVREMLSVTMAMVAERDAALHRQRRQMEALKAELRRYTAAQVS